MNKERNILQFMLPVSILAFLYIFVGGATLSSGFNQSFLQEVMQYISIFGGYVIEIVIILIAVYFIWKRKVLHFSKREMRIVYSSLVISSLYVLLFTFIWMELLRTGLH